MLDQYSNDLHKGPESDAAEKNFLTKEIKVLEESKWIGLPNFLPPTAFLNLLHRKVKTISSMPIEFTDFVWDYLEEVVVAILMRHSEYYHQLQACIRRAGKSLIAKMKDSSMKYMMEVVEMEKLTDYTCNPDYMSEYNKLMASQNNFLERVKAKSSEANQNSFMERVKAKSSEANQNSFMERVKAKSSKLARNDFGSIQVSYLTQSPTLIQQAFDFKMRLTAYWKILLRRLIDGTALHLQFRVFNLVNKDLAEEIVKDIMSQCGGGFEKLLEETPSVSEKCDKLNRSIKVLRESKEVVACIIDNTSSYGIRELRI